RHSRATMDSAREFLLTTKDFACIRTLVKRYSGIVLSDAKQALVYNRLARRLRHLGLTSFAAYCSSQRRTAMTRMMDSMTLQTNLLGLNAAAAARAQGKETRYAVVQ